MLDNTLQSNIESPSLSVSARHLQPLLGYKLTNPTAYHLQLSTFSRIWSVKRTEMPFELWPAVAVQRRHEGPLPQLVTFRWVLLDTVTLSLFQFRDPVYREWYGYLIEDGRAGLCIKGGLYKGEQGDGARLEGCVAQAFHSLPYPDIHSLHRLLLHPTMHGHVWADSGSPAPTHWRL